MAPNKYFKYKKGKTEIETNNKNGIWLACLDLIMQWISPTVIFFLLKIVIQDGKKILFYIQVALKKVL